jgi:uncharacterized protein (DUF488 family)
MTDQMPTLYTIGHSNQSLEEFIGLLRNHCIDVIVDVRSAPYSRWAPQFGKESLEQAVKLAGLRYLYLGSELGGRPDPDRRSDLYDAEGHALYYKMAQEDGFNDAIRRLHEGVARFRVAVMCSEEDPTDCHRRLLVGKVMTERWNVQLRHIRRGGHVDDEWLVDLARETRPRQRSLLPISTCDAGERDVGAMWRSIRSVSGG